ncbi:MAG: hypothetical protein JXA18_02750, partial [Chitinispirillaceae bacterium]|nr:hypothetical protein [Chitinispirillaceae bacterium]
EITRECRESLESTGCRLQHDEQRGEWALFVPKEGDVAALQRILYGNSVIPRKVVPRSMTLEELLYRRKTEGAS